MTDNRKNKNEDGTPAKAGFVQDVKFRLAEGIRSLNVEGSASVVGAFGHPQQVGPMKRQPICEFDKAGAEVG